MAISIVGPALQHPSLFSMCIPFQEIEVEDGMAADWAKECWECERFKSVYVYHFRVCMVKFVLIHFPQELMCSPMNHTKEFCCLIKRPGINFKEEHDMSDVNQTCLNYSSHQDDAMLREALQSASGGASEDAPEAAKGEEPEENWKWNWGQHGYGVRDAKWLEPKEEGWPTNPKSEDWDENDGWGDGQGWSKDEPWDDHNGWQTSTKWSGWNRSWYNQSAWKRKPRWAYQKEDTPHRGHYVKGGYEVDGEFYG